MIWDIIIKVGLACGVILIGGICYIIGYSKGMTHAYTKIKKG